MFENRRLTDDEVASYDLVPEDIARNAKLVRIPWVPGRYSAITLGKLMLLSRTEPDNGRSLLIAHELVHVQQWAEMGHIGFAMQYLRHFFGGLAKHRSWDAAYRAIPSEIEAYDRSETWFRYLER